MNALELADEVDAELPGNGDISAMLRKQDEAIKVLRKALIASQHGHEKAYIFQPVSHFVLINKAKEALAATEEMK